LSDWATDERTGDRIFYSFWKMNGDRQ
jgi:hypothetical protein